MKKFALLLSLTILGACSTDNLSSTKIDAKTVTFNDFESGGGWGNDPALFEKGEAHSGRYATKVDKDHEFSLTFIKTLGEISDSKFSKMHIEAWAFMPSERATGTLGLQIMSPDNSKQVFSDDIKLRDAVKTYGKWVLISKDITLPANITATQQLRLFLWRADASDTVLLDDVKLSVLE